MELEISMNWQLRKFQDFLLKNQSFLFDPTASFYDDTIIRHKQ